MHNNDLYAMWTCMPARNLQMIAYRTRVRDSSHDDPILPHPRGVRTHKATWILCPWPTNQRPRKRTITLLVLAWNTLRGCNIIFVPVLSCAHCCNLSRGIAQSRWILPSSNTYAVI